MVLAVQCAVSFRPCRASSRFLLISQRWVCGGSRDGTQEARSKLAAMGRVGIPLADKLAAVEWLGANLAFLTPSLIAEAAAAVHPVFLGSREHFQRSTPAHRALPALLAMLTAIRDALASPGTAAAGSDDESSTAPSPRRLCAPGGQ